MERHVELRQQKDRLNNIFSDIIYDLNITSKIPNMLQEDNMTQIKSFLTQKEYELFTKTSKSIKNKTNIHEDEASTLLLTIKQNGNLKSYMENLDCPKEKSIEEISELLQNIFSDRLKMTGEEAQKNDDNFEKACIMSDKYLRNIENLEKVLDTNYDKIEKLVEEQNLKQDEYDVKIKSLKENFDKEVKKLVLLSRRDLEETEKVYTDESNHMQKQIKALKREYNKIQATHMSEEKSLRQNKEKLEKDIEKTIENFDQDVGSTHKNYEELIKQLNNEKEQLKNLKEKVNHQKTEYDQLMLEKELEEELYRMELGAQFLLNYMARRIQGRWKEYVQRKALKKKKKGKVKSSGEKKSA